MKTLDEYFYDYPESRQIFEALVGLTKSLGEDVRIEVMKSQIKFIRNKAFAWVWIPGQYLRGKIAPLVLTLSFPQAHPSSRWKESVHPSPKHFIHHLELYSANDLDEQVRLWLREAWMAADW